MDRVPIQDAKIARVPWEYYTKGISDYYTNRILEYYTKGISDYYTNRILEYFTKGISDYYRNGILDHYTKGIFDYYTKEISDYYVKEVSRSRSRTKVNELAPEPCPSQFGSKS